MLRAWVFNRISMLRIAASCLALLLFGCGLSAESSAQQPILYPLFNALRLSPGERLSRFDLRISQGMVAGFCRAPVGWRIEIDNDPSWTSHISGIAIVGAADLEQKDFRGRLFSVLPAPKADRLDLALPELAITGNLWLSVGDKTRRVQIRSVRLVRARSGGMCGDREAAP